MFKQTLLKATEAAAAVLKENFDKALGRKHREGYAVAAESEDGMTTRIARDRPDRWKAGVTLPEATGPAKRGAAVDIGQKFAELLRQCLSLGGKQRTARGAGQQC